jgi:hypothetical protein
MYQATGFLERVGPQLHQHVKPETIQEAKHVQTARAIEDLNKAVQRSVIVTGGARLHLMAGGLRKRLRQFRKEPDEPVLKSYLGRLRADLHAFAEEKPHADAEYVEDIAKQVGKLGDMLASDTATELNRYLMRRRGLGVATALENIGSRITHS